MPLDSRFPQPAFKVTAPDIKDGRHTLIGGLDMKLGLSESFTLDMTIIPDFGFADIAGSSIIIGKRDVRRVENTLNTHYIFNRDVSLSFRLRHYWSIVNYLSYFNLADNGHLETSGYSTNNNTSFNAFNIDLVFTWRFAPGSTIDIVWENSILNDDDETKINFYDDVKKTIDSPQLNSFSIKLLYYLDYLQLKKRKS